jgi:hypothetical protein
MLDSAIDEKINILRTWIRMIRRLLQDNYGNDGGPQNKIIPSLLGDSRASTLIK